MFWGVRPYTPGKSTTPDRSRLVLEVKSALKPQEIMILIKSWLIFLHMVFSGPPSRDVFSQMFIFWSTFSQRFITNVHFLNRKWPLRQASQAKTAFFNKKKRLRQASHATKYIFHKKKNPAAGWDAQGNWKSVKMKFKKMFWGVRPHTPGKSTTPHRSK